MAPKKRSAAPKSEAELEEQRRKAAQAQLLQRQEQIDRETRNSKLNAIKVQNLWKELMRVAKSEALQEQLTLLKTAHERIGDRLEHKVQKLQQSLLECDAQFDTAYQAHLQNLDNLLSLQRNHISSLEASFQSRVHELEMDFSTERARLQKQHLSSRNDLLGVVYRLDQDFNETEADARHEFQSVCDDMKNRNLEERHALRIHLDAIIEELWRQFRTALSTYQAATEERQRQFEELKRRDEQAAGLIEGQLRRLARLTDAVAVAKTKLSALARESESKLAALRAGKEHVVKDFQILKRQMNCAREHERRKLIELTKLRISSARELEAHRDVAEKILTLGELCGKLCTEEEKAEWATVTCAANNNTNSGSSKASPGRSQPLPLEEALEAENRLLDNFHKLVNKVLLEKLVFEDRRDKLSHERDALRELLRTYVEGIGLTKDVLEKRNPLFVINGKANVTLETGNAAAAAAAAKRITVIEGVESYRSSHAAAR